MKKFISILTAIALFLMIIPRTFAAGGIYASGGGSPVAGSNFTIAVTANGASFNALEGTISVSGPVSIVGFSAGGAIWMTAPGNGVHFVGMLTAPTTALRVATITLKGLRAGSGAVSVSNVRLALSGSSVGTGAGGVNFNIQRAPTLPGTITVTSPTHPNPAQQYDATTVTLNWQSPENGAAGYSYVWDKTADTNPPSTVNTTATTVEFSNQEIGIYYFHIKGQNGDGWGNPTHFQVNIKEPENIVNKKLAKPKNITITKAVKFKNDLKNGNVTGLVIRGIIPTKREMEKYSDLIDPTKTDDPTLKAKANIYQANIILKPELKVPEGKSLSVKPDKNGNFRLLINFPIPAGPYKLTVQGQRAKTLTPKSDEIMFEISQVRGGTINILTKADANAPAKSKFPHLTLFNIAVAEGTIIIILALSWVISAIIRKRRTRSSKNNSQKDDNDKKNKDEKGIKDDKNEEDKDNKDSKSKKMFDWDIN